MCKYAWSLWLDDIRALLYRTASSRTKNYFLSLSHSLWGCSWHKESNTHIYSCVTGTIKGTYYYTYIITKINQMYYAFQWLTSCLNDLICSELMRFPSFQWEKGTRIWNVPRQSHIDLNCRDHGHTADAFSGNPGWGLIYFTKCMTRRHQHYSIGKKNITNNKWVAFSFRVLSTFSCYLQINIRQKKTTTKN